jgi:hypothetical protein
MNEIKILIAQIDVALFDRNYHETKLHSAKLMLSIYEKALSEYVFNLDGSLADIDPELQKQLDITIKKITR